MRVRLIPTSRRNHLNGPHTMSTGAVTIMAHGSTGESETESDEDDTPLENTNPSGACQEMQDKLDSCQADLTPMEHSVAWEVALKKMKSWRAPGPDCIHAHWYKAFPRLTGILGKWCGDSSCSLEAPCRCGSSGDVR